MSEPDDFAREVARLWDAYYPGDYYPDDLPHELTDALDLLADACRTNRED